MHLNNLREPSTAQRLMQFEIGFLERKAAALIKECQEIKDLNSQQGKMIKDLNSQQRKLKRIIHKKGMAGCKSIPQ